MKFLVLLLTLSLAAGTAAAQREASFVQPGKGGVSKNRDSDEIIAATPSAMDVGDTIVGITKRIRLYFTNYGGKDATIANVSLSADSNVRTEITSDDCSKVGKLKPNDKCSISVEITPNSPGKWTGELVMVHDAPGRVSRATLNGATAGDVAGAGQQPGLSLVGVNKDQLIDFGEVPSGENAVRSVLLANDSTSPLKIERMELVAADRSLTLLGEGGCKEGEEVAPGASCPVTVIWQPNGREVSTDLIIRHTGPMGFAVIPVRGKSAGGSGESSSSSASNTPVPAFAENDVPPPLPVAKSKIPPISAASLYGRGAGMPSSSMGSSLALRGTSGTRAILVDSEGKVMVADEGETIESDGGRVRILNVEPTRVMIDSAGAKIELNLVKPRSGSSKAATDKEGL